MSDILWHYTTAEAAFSIIDSGTLRFSDFRYMNDPTEGYGYSDALEKYFPEDKHKPWIESFEKVVNENMIGKRMFVFSLSRKRNHLNQWVGYGGVALGFELEDSSQDFESTECIYLSNKKNKDAPSEKLLRDLEIEDILYFSQQDDERFKLKYSGAFLRMKESQTDSPVYLRAKAEMLELEKEYPDIIGDHKGTDHHRYSESVGAGRVRDYVGAIPSCYGKFWVNVFKFKHPDYVDESEVRLLKHSVEPGSIKYRVRGNGVLPYVDVGFAPSSTKTSLKLVALDIGPFDNNVILKNQWEEYLAVAKEGVYKDKGIEIGCSATPYVGLKK